MIKPLLITRGIVILPQQKIEIEVGRQYSINAFQNAIKKDKKIILVSQIDPQIEVPTANEIYKIGTLCEIVDCKKSNDNESDVSYSVQLKGLERVLINSISNEEKHLELDGYSCEYKTIKLTIENKQKLKKELSIIRNYLTKNAISSDVLKTINESIDSIVEKNEKDEEYLTKIIDSYANPLITSQIERQKYLETTSLNKLSEIVLNYCMPKLEKEKIDAEITNKISANLAKQQKEFYLREKIRTIKDELGKLNPKEDSVKNLKEKVLKNPYPQNIKDRALSEISKLDSMFNPQEASITRTYLDWLLDLPYWQQSKDNNNLANVQETLNNSHYGLEKVKERIIEYLAVKTKSPKSKAPIICLVGPPGVGKSTLAMSIAQALNKKFVKMSLGGVRDEAEIRGHRKTYIGSMPGRIIKGMKQAGVNNPLFLLDELDKMATSTHLGDPASALLEILDIEQNNRFADNYIDEEYDLSNVLFVATANYPEQIPAPLYDRLEIIELTSYTEREKYEIAKKYLIPKILKDSTVPESEITFTEKALYQIIRNYTREAGVRQLERLISTIIRKHIVATNNKKDKKETINEETVLKYLKKPIFDFNVKDTKPIAGVVNGMAYSTAGGDLLPIEVTHFSGKGNIIITGNLRETMKESASVALGYVKANAKKFGLEDIDFQKIDLHVHVPSGGIPKDGPSAGVTLTTAIISALSNRPVPSNIAMTGEITLRGKVLIIGGVKEKVISSFRGGINEIFMPKKDEVFLDDVPPEVKNKIKFHFVETYDEIYNIIFKHKK